MDNGLLYDHDTGTYLGNGYDSFFMKKMIKKRQARRSKKPKVIKRRASVNNRKIVKGRKPKFRFSRRSKVTRRPTPVRNVTKSRPSVKSKRRIIPVRKVKAIFRRSKTANRNTGVAYRRPTRVKKPVVRKSAKVVPRARSKSVIKRPIRSVRPPQKTKIRTKSNTVQKRSIPQKVIKNTLVQTNKQGQIPSKKPEQKLQTKMDDVKRHVTHNWKSYLIGAGGLLGLGLIISKIRRS